jgi:alanine-synthesizing transaminase
MAKLPAIASARMHLLPPYIFGELNRIKHEKRKAGVDIIDFGMGNPTDPTPDKVVKKLCEAAQDPRNHRYSAAAGVYNLRREAARFYERRYGVELDPDTEVIATIGSKEGLSHLCLAILGPGESALVPTPAFPIHVYAPIIAGANVIGISMGEGSDEECQERTLRGIAEACRAISPRPKVVIVCSPHNPTARVYTAAFYRELIALARKHGFVIIHDFAYAQTAFDGFKPPSVLELEGAREVACEFWTMSKPYNMAGWRVGFCVGNRDMIMLLGKIKGYFDYGLFQAVQVAAIVALRHGDADAARQAAIYQKRRDVLCKGLRDLGWELNVPQGGMFVWARMPAAVFQMGSMEYARLLIEKAMVAASPGVGFGADGEGYMRFAIVENEKRIQQALRQMRRMSKEKGQ